MTRKGFDPTAYRINLDGSRSPLPLNEPKPGPGWLSYKRRRQDDERWLRWKTKRLT